MKVVYTLAKSVGLNAQRTASVKGDGCTLATDENLEHGEVYERQESVGERMASRKFNWIIATCFCGNGRGRRRRRQQN